MKCEDCIHYEVCRYTISYAADCTHCFKQKGQYIFLPAYVGQKVWTIFIKHEFIKETNKFEISGYELKNGKVSMLQQKADKSWKIRISRSGGVADYTIDEFNRLVYVTEEAAKAELARLENELSKNKI